MAHRVAQPLAPVASLIERRATAFDSSQAPVDQFEATDVQARKYGST
jgi:hypothetical protein